MDDQRLKKMERDIKEVKEGQNTLSIDVAVINTKLDNICQGLDNYMSRKDETDKDQYSKLDNLENTKADKKDINNLISTVKWAVGSLIALIALLVPFLIQ